MPKVGSLFSGYGGLDQACEAAFGAETRWVSDIDPGACKILAHRYPDLPNHGDITKIDWTAVEPVDILTGGFPCQDVSHAGKRAGLRPDTRSGLWSQMAYAVEQLRPRYVVAENVRGLLSAEAHSSLEPCPWCLGGSGDGEPDLRALGCVLGDLAELGYDAQWVGLRAADVGAPHGRFRVFVLATDTTRKPGSVGHGDDVRARWGTLGPGAEAGRGSATDAESLGRERSRRTRDGRPGLAHDGLAAADAISGGRERWGSDELAGAPEHAAGDGERGLRAPADASGERHGRGQDRREVGRVDGGAEGEARQRERARAKSGDRGAEVAADAISGGLYGRSREARRGPERRASAGGDSRVDWGQYAPAVERWQRVLGRVAPAPTETSAKGTQRLSPSFVEFMMGLPEGWVTEVPDLNRNAQLKALGNGVVPQQAYAAITRMLAA